jgi:hypothetical protein
MKPAIFGILGENLTGGACAPKIAAFCYEQIFLCQKKPIFTLFANPL